MSWVLGAVEGGANNVQATSHTEVMLLWTCLRSIRYVLGFGWGGRGGPCILKRCYAGLVLGLRLVLGFGVGSRSGKKRSGCP